MTANTDIKNIIRRLWYLKLSLQRWIIIASSSIFSLLVFIQVIFRYFLDVPLYGLEEIAVYMGVWLYFIGYSFATSRKFHISACLTEAFMKPGMLRDSIEAFSFLMAAIIAGWITVWGFQYFLWTIKIGSESVELSLPLGWVYAAIPVGLGLSAVYYFIEFLEKASCIAFHGKYRFKVLDED